jgi:hypothetical protein
MNSISYDAKTDVFKGQLMVSLGGLPIAFATSANLEVSQDTLDASNKMSGDWDNPIPGKKSFQITTDQLLTSLSGAVTANSIIDSIISGNTYDFVFGHFIETSDSTDSNKKTYALDTAMDSYKGTIVPTQLSVKSEHNAIASSSATFKGQGALTKTAAVSAAA